MKDLIQLKRKRLANSHVERFADDIANLKKMLNAAGYEANALDIAWAWELHSSDWCAGWLMVDYYSKRDVERTVEYLLVYLEPVTEQ